MVKTVSEHEQLLNEARPFCDPATGEVVKRIPEELMQRLRAAKLARGIRNKPGRRTNSQATWFVFLSEEIRDRVLGKRRKVLAVGITKPVNGTGRKLDSPKPRSRPSASRGLKAFLQQRKETA